MGLLNHMVALVFVVEGTFILFSKGLPGSSAGEESACNAGDSGPGFNPWVGKIPQRRAWTPTPVFLPGESPWTEKPGGLQSMGPQRVGHD